MAEDAQAFQIDTGGSAEELARLKDRAAALRDELASLRGHTAAFADKLRAVGQAQQQLEALGGAMADAKRQAQAGTEAAEAANEALAQSERKAEAAQQQRAERRQADLAAERQAAEERRAIQEGPAEAAADAHIRQTERRMAAIDALSRRQEHQLNYERRLGQARVEVAEAATSAVTALNEAAASGSKELAAAQKALFLFNKAMAVREVVINTQKQIAQIQATYAAAPPVAAALTAKAVAAGALRVATISAQTVPKLAGGGVLKGAPHKEGGIQLVDRRSGQVTAEAEGGEVVLTGGVSRNPQLLQLASQLNQLAGGVRLEQAMPQPHMARGGTVPATPPPSNDSGALRRLEALAERLSQRPQQVSVTEIRRVQQRVQVLEDGRRL
jgi:hypothetical protein